VIDAVGRWVNLEPTARTRVSGHDGIVVVRAALPGYCCATGGRTRVDAIRIAAEPDRL